MAMTKRFKLLCIIYFICMVTLLLTGCESNDPNAHSKYDDRTCTITNIATLEVTTLHDIDDNQIWWRNHNIRIQTREDIVYEFDYHNHTITCDTK